MFIRISRSRRPRRRLLRHRRRHRQKLPRPPRRRSRRSTQATRCMSSRTRTLPKLKATSLQPRRRSPRRTPRPQRPAVLSRQRRTKRPHCVPSSNKHERSATWHGQNANRQSRTRAGEDLRTRIARRSVSPRNGRRRRQLRARDRLECLRRFCARVGDGRTNRSQGRDGPRGRTPRGRAAPGTRQRKGPSTAPQVTRRPRELRRYRPAYIWHCATENGLFAAFEIERGTR